MSDPPKDADAPQQRDLTDAPSTSAKEAADVSEQAQRLATTHDSWQGLRRFTPARIALGRVGASLPTAEVLALSMAHARARDAVHVVFDADALTASLEQAGFSTLQAASQAATRSEYLRRPDLGRRLNAQSFTSLAPQEPVPAHRLTVLVGDGLSSLAPARHALPFLEELRSQLAHVSLEWVLDAVIVSRGARVALGDQAGEVRGAEAVVVMLGERPGLSSPDSLGLYMTYAPRCGRSDAERNCLSNVRREGLSYAEAAYKLIYLLEEARRAGKSGTAIKDSSDWTGSGSLPASGMKGMV